MGRGRKIDPYEVCGDIICEFRHAHGEDRSVKGRCSLNGALCAVLIAGSAAHGDSSVTHGAGADYLKRLESDDPNYFVLAAPVGDGELKDDDLHIEFYLSVKYPVGLDCVDSPWLPKRFLFVYNGLYDFYLFPGGRYESSPVISRRQNPGGVLEWDLYEKQQARVGYYHESNGQTIDRMDGPKGYDVQLQQGGEEYALTQVSRGWDYVNLRYRYGERDAGEYPWTVQAELRFFLPWQGFGASEMEDSIFWEQDSRDVGIEDYDGLRFMCERRFSRSANAVLRVLGKGALRLELKTSISSMNALGNIGGKASLTFRDFVNLFYFRGYGKEPATYHRRTEYVGIGVQLR